MSARPERGANGSRFLYEPFAPDRVGRAEMVERVVEARWDGLEHRLVAIETMLVRLDRRMWLAVAGVVSALLAEALQGFLGPAG